MFGRENTKSTPLSALAVLLLAFGFVSILGFVPLTHASGTVTVTTNCSTGTCPPGFVVDIIGTVIVPAEASRTLNFAVFAPDGKVYELNNFVTFFNGDLSAAGVGTCIVPFGGSGTMSGSLTASGIVDNCSGSNSGAWEQVTGVSPGECAFSFTGLSFEEGSTLQPGTYTVLACSGSGDSATTQFTISATEGVPQFPLGFGLLFVLLVPALMVIWKKTLPSRRTLV